MKCFKDMNLFMGALLISLFSVAAPVVKPRKVVLPPGPVKTVLKRNYKLHLVRNFAQEAEKEIEIKYLERYGSRSSTGK